MSTGTNDAVLVQILAQLNALQVSQQTLQAKVTPPFFADVSCHNTHCIHIHMVLKLDALATPSPPQSPRRDGISIPGRNGPESLGSPSSSNLLLSPSPSLTRAHLASSTPPTSTPSDHPLTDREREKALYPGRVILASEFSSSVDLEYDVYESMFRAAPPCNPSEFGSRTTLFTPPPHQMCLFA
jgi:hypothetical protein